MKKSIWRLIIGILLMAGVARNLANRPVGQTHDVFVWYLAFNILLAALGVWLAVSYLRRPN